MTNYKNDDVDAWLDELGNTLDEAKREELLSKIQKQVVDCAFTLRYNRLSRWPFKQE